MRVSLEQINEQLISIIKPTLISLLVLGLYHHLTFQPQTKFAVVDMQKPLTEQMKTLDKANLSVDEKTKRLGEYSQALKTELQTYAKENRITLFAKGALISEATEITQGNTDVR